MDKLTVFNGGIAFVRMVHGPAFPNGGVWAPEVVELDIPTGLHIVVPRGYGQTDGSGYENVTDVSKAAGGGAVPAGYSRLRLNKQVAYEWSYLNIAITLRVEVDAALEGKTFPLARIRGYTGAHNQQRTDNWQPLAITVKAINPVPKLPQRLHTSFCWAEPFQFVDDAAKGLSSVATWKALGFNTVPGDGASYATPPGGGLGGHGGGDLLSPANRTGAAWKGMNYGIMASPFTGGGLSAPPYGLGCFAALQMPVAAASSDVAFNFSLHGLSPAEEKEERAKWRNALLFFQANKIMDLSYDGYFRHHDLAVVSQLVNYSQPQYLLRSISLHTHLYRYTHSLICGLGFTIQCECTARTHE